MTTDLGTLMQPRAVGADWCAIVAKADDDGAESSAEIRIYDEIGGWWGTSAKEFADQIAELDVDRIDLYVNSPGGSAWDGIAIMNALRRHRARVVVTVDGLAASAASLICMAADHLTMAGSSQLMIHDASGLCWGNASDMAETAALLDKLSDSYADGYARRAGGTRAEWRDVMKAETWYTAEEAVLAGLADEWDGSSESQAVATFDLRRFVHPGRAAAPAPTLPVAASLVPPVSSEPGSTNPEMEGAMPDEILMAGLRERLGLTETDGAEAILAAVDNLADQPTAEVAPMPEGVALIESDQLAALQAAAAEVAAMRAERDAERRAGMVDAAVADGRITPARRDHWLAQLNADEEGVAGVLAALPSVLPVVEVGHSDDVETADTALFARLYGAESKEA